MILALVDEGEEVIIPTPYWVTYSELVKIARGKVVEVRTSLESGFKVTPAQLEAAITDKTKVFMFSSPCNPSGAVYSKEELEALAKYSENIRTSIFWLTRYMNISILWASMKALPSSMI